MPSGPSKAAETIVGIFVPPACREEVLGDLHERFQSPSQYAADALRAVPWVIASRIRRTADAQILIMQAFALYGSFLCGAWLTGSEVLLEARGFWRMAIPAALILAGLVLDDTYAKPGRRSSLSLCGGPLLGVIIALASEAILRLTHSDLALPQWTLLTGCAISLLLSTAMRMLFPPVTSQFLGANAPALWLKRAASFGAIPQWIIQALKGASVIMALAILVLWAAERLIPLKPAHLLVILICVGVVYQISRHAGGAGRR